MLRISRTAIVCAFLGAGCSGPAPPPFHPVVDLKQLMKSVLDPAADEYWDAVGYVIDEKGTTEIAPTTMEEWDHVRDHAVVVAETGNLLMMFPRAKDGGEWMTFSRELVDAGLRAMRAAEARDKQAVFDMGGEVYDVCTRCHEKYAREAPDPRQP
jgi:hypothetical protein